ncbi:hypothetical protein [Halosimplex halobium]|uniref:hypothetical protein n=1 Tax=Halosimplex halobium TaxID=3396618 RepID=UPI003F57E1C4
MTALVLAGGLSGLGAPAFVGIAAAVVVAVVLVRKIGARIPLSIRRGPVQTFVGMFAIGMLVGLAGYGPVDLARAGVELIASTVTEGP